VLKGERAGIAGPFRLAALRIWRPLRRPMRYCASSGRRFGHPVPGEFEPAVAGATAAEGRFGCAIPGAAALRWADSSDILSSANSSLRSLRRPQSGSNSHPFFGDADLRRATERIEERVALGDGHRAGEL